MKLQEIDAAMARLRGQLEELETVVQKAPGAHRPGQVGPETLRDELAIRDLVLALIDLDRRRQELTVELSLSR